MMLKVRPLEDRDYDLIKEAETVIKKIISMDDTMLVPQ